MSGLSDIAGELILRELGPGWEIEDEQTVVCPHGHAIEWDGVCPDGCVSPLRELGLI